MIVRILLLHHGPYTTPATDIFGDQKPPKISFLSPKINYFRWLLAAKNIS
jgi:hypothetical protein